LHVFAAFPPTPPACAVLPAEQVLERRSASSTLGVRGAAAEVAEDRAKELGEVAGPSGVSAEVAREVARAPRPARLSAALRVALPVRTQAVVAAALLGVREDLVGLADLLELVLVFLALGDVGMVLPGELPEGRLDGLLVGLPVDSQNLVVVLELNGHMNLQDV